MEVDFYLHTPRTAMASKVLLSLDTIFTLLFRSIFDPTSSLSLLIPFSFTYVYLSYASSHSWQNNKDTIWLVTVYQTIYSWHWLSDCHTITWLWSPRNSPSLMQPPNPVLEPLWRPALAPINQSSGLPKHGVWVGVHQLHKDPNWLQGSSKVPQQDLPNLELPFVKPHPQTFWGTSLFWPEQGRSVHQPPGSQWHCPTESL